MVTHKRIVFILIFCIVIAVFVMCFLYEPYTSSKEIIHEFNKNYDSIVKITTYMQNAPYSSIDIQGVDYIYAEDGKMGMWYVNNKGSEGDEYIGEMPIDNEDIVKELTEMFRKHKYQVIDKDGNTIYIQMWSNLDAGSGIAYTVDGVKPQIQFLTKLEKLDKENWYYYEADFNKWKQENE